MRKNVKWFVPVRVSPTRTIEKPVYFLLKGRLFVPAFVEQDTCQALLNALALIYGDSVNATLLKEKELRDVGWHHVLVRGDSYSWKLPSPPPLTQETQQLGALTLLRVVDLGNLLATLPDQASERAILSLLEKEDLIGVVSHLPDLFPFTSEDKSQLQSYTSMRLAEAALTSTPKEDL